MRTVQDLLTDPIHGLVSEVRPAQLTMAASIERVLAEGGAYFVEAPVATGKTYAYLLATLLAQGRRAVITTAKKTLQDQVLQKDFPAVIRALGTDIPPARALPLKGKANYACRRAAYAILEKTPIEGIPYFQFLQRSLYGDRAEYGDTPPRWWSAATAEDCIHRKCEHFNACGFASLKRELQQARLVVINHHLLGSEMFYGHGKLVGGPYDVLIIDEAHALAAGIRAAFTHRVAEDSIVSLNELLKRTNDTFTSVRRLLPTWKAMFDALPAPRWTKSSAKDTPVFSEDIAGGILDGLAEVQASITQFAKLYGANVDDDGAPVDDDIFVGADGESPIEIDLDAQALNAEEAKNTALAVITQAQRRVDSLIRGLSMAQGIIALDLDGTLEQQAVRRARILANTAVYESQDARGIYGINCAPVNIGGIAGKFLGAIKTVVVCSATLAVDGKFDHVTSVTGVIPARVEILPTAFNYAQQGLAFIPKNLPHVTRDDPDYAMVLQRRVATAVHLAELSDGGAFVLTTANDELDAFTVALKHRFPGRTFAQGHRKNPWDGDPYTTLSKFKATPDSILVGSKSFWEGVDVPGAALRLVIMTNLPFPMKNDPIVEARERIAGNNAFNEVQLVDMLIDLRQGIGRLIRTREDRGCAAILDSRVWQKAYGGMVLRALPWPPTLITSDMRVCENLLPRYVEYFRLRAFAG